MTNETTALIMSPYLNVLLLMVKARLLKSGLAKSAAMSGVSRSLTNACTTVPKAAPTTMPTARSITLPRSRNALNPDTTDPPFRLAYVRLRLAAAECSSAGSRSFDPRALGRVLRVDRGGLRYADTVRQGETPEAARVRIDKWLWAARFFKTRSLAAEAVDGGKVHVNGDRVKAARSLKPGDRLTIRRGPEEVELVVVALAEQRGSAAVAEALYQETEASVARRLALAEERRMLANAEPRLSGRPDKRSRRAIVRFTRRD